MHMLQVQGNLSKPQWSKTVDMEKEGVCIQFCIVLVNENSLGMFLVHIL